MTSQVVSGKRVGRELDQTNENEKAVVMLIEPRGLLGVVCVRKISNHHSKSKPNFWKLPVETAEFYDSSDRHTAVRGAQEETGIETALEKWEEIYRELRNGRFGRHLRLVLRTCIDSLTQLAKVGHESEYDLEVKFFYYYEIKEMHAQGTFLPNHFELLQRIGVYG